MLEQLVELAAVGAPVPETLPALISALYADEVTPVVESDTSEARVAIPEEGVASAEPAPVMAAITPTLNVATALIDDNLNRAGEINVAIGQLNAHIAGVLERANCLAQQLTLVQSQVYELETIVDTRGIPTLPAQQHHQEDFDPLELDEYTALHSLSRAFAESTLDSSELSRDLGDELLKLQNLMAQHARLGRELTDSIMSARLVPVATIVPRLERIVRQTSRQTGHQAELEIHGRELAIDTDILAGLVEPLMHALRNAVDHGIESAQERLAAGKDATGRIRLSFRRAGNRIEVRCTDDGRGLDYGSIERHGRERGLFAPGRRPSMAELAALIFLPGFSTRSEVSVVSGRGVGMDVVRASVERLKGTTHIESRSGDGCTLTFRLPLSLTAAHVLFVAVGEGIYGFPSTAVDHVLYSDAGRVVQMGEQHAFEYGGRICALHALGTLLGQPCEILDDLQAQPRPLVIVSTDTGHVALIVDRALDSRQVIIKGLSPLLPSLPGVAGASVLPNGSIGVILEVRELLRQGVAAFAVPAYDPPAAVTQPRALVVDDSLSARRALAQLLTDCGYEVVTAVDGIDAIARVEQQTPDLVLADLEMPRMNGLELTAHLRNRDLTRSVPIVMITSRGAEKHRAQALRAGVTDYLTKPYAEQELLDRLYKLMPPCRPRP
jgi:chemosensory pili system protein ChpA (sensor histidine kinase/response regulator)